MLVCATIGNLAVEVPHVNPPNLLSFGHFRYFNVNSTIGLLRVPRDARHP
jgi:hypothetical protein